MCGYRDLCLSCVDRAREKRVWCRQVCIVLPCPYPDGESGWCGSKK